MENHEVISFGDLPVKVLMHCDELTEDELMHYGVLGMKWGVRRYQNKDGSLTNAGKKRYDRLEAELNSLKGARDKPSTPSRREVRAAEKRRKQKVANLEKARKAKAQKQKEAEDAEKEAAKRAKKIEKDKISVDKMTSEEIQAKIDRINLENRLKSLMDEPVKEVPVAKKNRGKEFGDKFKDDLIDKLAKNVAADLVSQTVKAAGAYGINKLMNDLIDDKDKDGNKIVRDYVFSNNKRKDK